MAGCSGLWDEVSSSEFSIGKLFYRPSPLAVLRDSKDGDHRARALRALKEPRQHGGSEADQDAVVAILTTAASSEHQALCRMAAIQSLRHFKDPRAVEGLKEAYYRAGSFNPDTATIIRCQALEALGDTRNPAAVELLVKVLREPPVEGPEQDRQQKMDERIAAARSLGQFKHYQAAEALVAVLRTEQDVALRDSAHSSLESATGKHLPADAQVWADFLHQPGNQAPVVAEESLPKKVLDWITPVGWNQK
jgi:HEAT repeat protein